MLISNLFLFIGNFIYMYAFRRLGICLSFLNSVIVVSVIIIVTCSFHDLSMYRFSNMTIASIDVEVFFQRGVKKTPKNVEAGKVGGQGGN